MLQFDLVTIFPDIFSSYLQESILGRAQKNKKIVVHAHDLRAVTTDRHHTVDDKPYGGGVGMVMMVEPIVKTLQSIKRRKKSKIILLSAKGQRFDQKTARRYAKLDQLILISGRYEGVDERVTQFIDEEISIGDYVLTGGELPSLIIVDAVTRLLPGVLGKDESNEDESFSLQNKKEYPHYTRPEIFKWKGKELCVPKILLSGNHKHIIQWKNKQRKK